MLADQYLQRRPGDAAGVLGVDVAGDEGGYPLSTDDDPMAAGLHEAARRGVPITVHAGEWPEQFGSLSNLEWAVSSGLVRRVGHGVAVRSAQDTLIQAMIIL